MLPERVAVQGPLEPAPPNDALKLTAPRLWQDRPRGAAA
jgi:hypothetical protein